MWFDVPQGSILRLMLIYNLYVSDLQIISASLIGSFQYADDTTLMDSRKTGLSIIHATIKLQLSSSWATKMCERTKLHTKHCELLI